MIEIPYDITDPPADPPPGVDALLWKVAFALRSEHEAGPDGWCIAGTCHGHSVLSPCKKRELADAGLLGSIGGGVQPPPRPNERRQQARVRTIRPPRGHER